MERMKEIERFDVRDEKGRYHTIVRRQELSGQVRTYESLTMLSGIAVNAHPEDPDLFILPIGWDDPYVMARRVR